MVADPGGLLAALQKLTVSKPQFAGPAGIFRCFITALYLHNATFVRRAVNSDGSLKTRPIYLHEKPEKKPIVDPILSEGEILASFWLVS